MKKRILPSAKKDFTQDLLPQTRTDQFFSLLKNQYMTLFKSGLMLLLCLLPFLICDLVRNVFDSGFYNEFIAKTITEQEYHFYLFFDLMVQTGIELLFIPVLAIAISGINLVLKEMVEGDFVLFWDDFKTGVKLNYKITIIITIIFGIFTLAMRFVVNYFIALYFVTIPVYVFFVLFVIPVTLICLLFSSYYQGNYFNVLSNSTKLYAPSWWKYLVSGIVLFAFVFGFKLLFDGLLAPYLKTIAYVPVIIILLPLGMLLLHSISISVFDKYINPEFYPENTNKGLYKPRSVKSKKDSK